jgi:hypothetical protein
VRFVSEWRQNGATSAKSQGGDQRSHRIEAHRKMILSVIKAKPDMTLVQIAEMLEAETGASFAPSSRPVRLAGSGRVSAARPGSAQTKRPPDRPTVFSLAVGVDALDLL